MMTFFFRISYRVVVIVFGHANLMQALGQKHVCFLSETALQFITFFMPLILLDKVRVAGNPIAKDLHCRKQVAATWLCRSPAML
jgi:hypothetical protein